MARSCEDELSVVRHVDGGGEIELLFVEQRGTCLLVANATDDAIAHQFVLHRSVVARFHELT